MISARGRARTRRYLLIGLMISLIIHLFSGSLFELLARAVDRIMPQAASHQEQATVQSDIIRLERAQPTARPVAVVQPHPHPPPPPPPAPHPAVQPVPAPLIVRPEIAHIVVHAPHQYAPSRGEGAVEMPHIVSPAAGPPGTPRPYYSQDQLAQLSSTFAQTIADAHQTLQQANTQMQQAPVVTSKHYEMHFNGIHEGMNPGDGIISFIKFQRIGNTIWYWTHYEYMYGDGHVEEDDIPWPFHYPVNEDPFARGDRRIPLQPPPAGYKPDRELKPVLMQFFGGPEVN
jgi:hypothetical protein